jgi:hypothetical protein
MADITKAEIETAIQDILLNGQEVVVGDRTFKAGDLNDLRKMLAESDARERSAAGTLFMRATFGTVR